MPRYFFNTADGGVNPDDHGMELPDDTAARVAAVRYAGDVLSDQPDVLGTGRHFRVEVVREDGTQLSTIVTLAVDALFPDPQG